MRTRESCVSWARTKSSCIIQDMPPFLATVTGALALYRYPLVFFGAMVEGPVLMMACGLLLRLGQFSFWPVYLSLVAGDFVSDILWYYAGKHAAEPFLRRFGHIFGVTESAFQRMERAFAKHDTKILILSKVTMGLGFALATILAAGAVRVPLRKFAFINLVGGFVWVGILLAVGYFLGNAYLFVDESFRVASLIAAAVVVLGAFYGFINFVRRKFANA